MVRASTATRVCHVLRYLWEAVLTPKNPSLPTSLAVLHMWVSLGLNLNHFRFKYMYIITIGWIKSYKLSFKIQETRCPQMTIIFMEFGTIIVIDRDRLQIQIYLNLCLPCSLGLPFLYFYLFYICFLFNQDSLPTNLRILIDEVLQS